MTVGLHEHADSREIFTGKFHEKLAWQFHGRKQNDGGPQSEELNVTHFGALAAELDIRQHWVTFRWQRVVRIRRPETDRPNQLREGFPVRNHHLDWSAAGVISTSRHDVFAGCN
ncbi:hypothetical protein [Burkholderia latens]|uniref:hypothetical protein n=1 Tax=Burkholderia latens TaxID=488446 RepID=UPI0039A48A39